MDLPPRQEANGNADKPNNTKESRIDDANVEASVFKTPSNELEVRVQQRTAELQESSEALFSARELLQVTLACIGDAVITTDLGGMITFLNPVAERLTGWTNSEATGLPITGVFRILSEESREPIENPVTQCLRDREAKGLPQETLLVRREGDEVSIDDTAAPIFDTGHKLVGAVLIFRDVTEKRSLARKLAHQAIHDPLTGLTNRREFERRLSDILSDRDRNEIHALLYIDVDQFKIVNDTHGHIAGDALLCQLSAILQSKIRGSDLLARLGGDEFGILLERCATQRARHIANDLRQAVHNRCFQWEGRNCTVTVSVGLVPIEPDDYSISKLLIAADSACYIAKDQGRNRVHQHATSGSATMERREHIVSVARIDEALRENDFRLYYQPIIALQGSEQKVDRGEVLLRLAGEESRIFLPDAFLPAAERFHQMVAIDRWVVRQSFKALRERLAAIPTAIYCINLSGHSLSDEEFLSFVVEEFRNSEIRPDSVCFEITETAAIANLVHAVRFISTLRDRGCQFSLDDFGTGLSSLAYLRTLPVDYVKIAGRFITGMTNDPVDCVMVESINRIAHVMGIRTIAEWVEDEGTLTKLRNMGVDYAQGWAIGMPTPIKSGNGPDNENEANLPVDLLAH